MITVLVTGAGGGVGQGIIKSLRLISDLPLRILGADMSALSAGLYACDKAFLVEGCRSPGYLDSLARIFQSESVDYYFPGTDIELALCAENRDRIAEHFGTKVVVNSPETVRIADDKGLTSAFLANNGLPHPRTWPMAEALETDDLVYPVIAKPAVGFRSIGVERVNSREELTNYPGDPAATIVQELIGDDSREFTCTIVGAKGSLSPVLALRRVLRSGDTYRAIPERNPVIADYVTAIARKLDVEGACNFQLRLGDDGVPKVFEINARFSGTTPFCAQLGFNPVECYLKTDRGLPYEPEIAWDSMVLRYWSELVVPRSMTDTLDQAGQLEPQIPAQFSLYGGTP
ncbi:ATP-grasp domain-containing protein [Ruegeria arenilitoris]|uniref:ATP-grasp domain-containing protein n=1 Tax=Ruegeria arenilitoris TaxID=1173585 RepID=UPI00147FD274|nr:ATP-grasp domain-containing protein [Ruegeria arenilitoris]